MTKLEKLNLILSGEKVGRDDLKYIFQEYYEGGGMVEKLDIELPYLESINTKHVLDILDGISFQNEIIEYKLRHGLAQSKIDFEWIFDRQYVCITDFVQSDGSYWIPLNMLVVSGSGKLGFWFGDRLYLSLDGLEVLNEYECLEKEILPKVRISDPKTYLMFDANTGMVKIGKSTNPKARESTLQSEKPTISLFATLSKDIESDLHKIHSDHRVRGEWFKLTMDQVLDIVNTYGFKIKQSKAVANAIVQGKKRIVG